MAEKLDKFYENILAYIGAKADTDGEIRTVEVDEKGASIPLQVDGKSLLMPNKAGFSKYSTESTIIFHPLREYIDRGESEVVKKLRYLMMIRFNVAIFSIMAELVTVASSPDKHPRLTPEQRQMILSLPELDQTSVKDFSSQMSKVWAKNPSSAFLSIFLKKAGRYRGQVHSRVGVVSYNFDDTMQRLIDDKTFRRADTEAFPKLFEAIFEGYKADAEAYNSYSDSKDFPWFECLLKTCFAISGRLNEILDLFKDVFSEATLELRFHHDWVAQLDNIAELSKEISMVPAQRGNEGLSATENTPPKEERVSPPPVPARRNEVDDRRDARGGRDDYYRREPESRQENSNSDFVTFDEVLSRSPALDDARRLRSPISDYIDSSRRDPRYRDDPRDYPRDYRDDYRRDPRDSRYRDEYRGRDPRDDYRRDPRDSRYRDEYRELDDREYRGRYRDDDRRDDYRRDSRNYRDDPRLSSRDDRPVRSPLYR